MPRALCAFAVVGALALAPREARAFWVVNFGPAPTLAPGRFAFAGGMGGQIAFTGEPARTSAVLFIPHAGLRVGLASFVDVGYRLAPVALPFASVGPSLGGNLDVKFRLTPADMPWQFAAVIGSGVAHVVVQDNDRFAFSANGAFLLSTHLSERVQLTFMPRYVYIGIPTAAGGDAANHVHIAGLSAGLRIALTQVVSVLPELGAYWYEGRLADRRTAGPGFQYGVVFAAGF